MKNTRNSLGEGKLETYNSFSCILKKNVVKATQESLEKFCFLREARMYSHSSFFALHVIVKVFFTPSGRK